MIDTFIKRPVFTTMIVMLLVVFGLGAYPTLGIDLNPDVEFPIVTVTITYTGASPEEMESLITKPVEDAVSSVSGIKSLSSVSREGTSQVTLEFEFGTNPKLAANEIREKVAGVRKRLPDQIDEPVVQRFDITAQSIVYFSLASDTRSRGEIRKLAIDVVKDELQRMDGVAQVDVFGATDREIHIFIDPKKIESYNISFQQIRDAINDQNLNTPGGKVNEKGTELTVRTMGKYKSVDEIKNIIVANQDGRLITLKDVVTIEDGWAEERVYAHTNGTPSVIISVQKQSGTNTVDVAERVKRAMENMQTNVLPQDIKVSIVRDSSKYIRSSVEDVMVSLLFGGLLAVVITFLFLQNTRATMIGAIAIPTSIIATFFAMKVMGFTLNNMSLMGLSLAVGILIDDAIVVIENIFRHMEDGLSPMEAARVGTTEISLAVVATTLSILAVFVPVGNMGEIIGQFFKQFGITVAFAVAFSLFVAFTLTPTLAAYWLKNNHGESLQSRWSWLQKILDVWETGFLSLRDNYKLILQWALKRPKKLVALAVLSLFLNGLLLPFIGVEFQPTYDSGEFNVMLTASSGTSMEKMKELVEPIEKEVLSIPELESAFVLIGTNRQLNKVNIGIRLIDSADRSRSMSQIMDQLRIKFRTVQNLKVAVQSNQGMGRGDSRPVQVGIRGPELEVLNRSAFDLAEAIKQISGTTDVDISSDQSEPEVQVKLDPVRAAELGINSTIAGEVIQMAFLGITTKNQYNVADSDYDIRVQMQPSNRLSMSDVANLRISSKTGGFVRLADIANVKFSSGPTQIDRESRQRQVIVYANTVGVSTGEVLTKIKEIIPSINLPLGYTYKFVGQAQMMQDSFKEIGKALLLAIVLIYMVLAAEFESFIHPLTIMLSLPFSLVGAVLGLLISGKTINMMSLIGIIMLMGLVTKNAILLIDHTIQLRNNGMSIQDALVEAGVLRLRPILMTTMAMIFGMMPVALGLGAGAELRSSMGVVLIGGLITSTFLTLIIVPLVYFLIDQMQQSFKKSKTEKNINL
ncbi:efflux RND transporter permease subunit [Pelosinus sp. UFO1]|uniref:efflux RND transporter permease subunit n=1 Tax=Pelosinus sp. UFO1 TaxID=484770 RepID=UPI0004D1EAA1|nr:efflux RND transporter permease subunit [Pelosinus sp. UFO1]AIF51779.1 acriflavin resistance protein [Pelosinus sp. UFO1]